MTKKKIADNDLIFLWYIIAIGFVILITIGLTNDLGAKSFFQSYWLGCLIASFIVGEILLHLYLRYAGKEFENTWQALLWKPIVLAVGAFLTTISLLLAEVVVRIFENIEEFAIATCGALAVLGILYLVGWLNYKISRMVK